MNTKRILSFVTTVTLILMTAVIIDLWQKGILTSEDSMRAYIAGFGVWAEAAFVFLQLIQVVIPVIPGGIGCLVGVVAFGFWKGFVLNYIGICAGSVISFLIARHYGWPLIKGIFSQKMIDRYQKWTEDGRFSRFFAAAIFFPLAPDDFLCYLAGTTAMSLPVFTLIILLGKPLSIILYSTGLHTVFTKITALQF